MSPFYVKTIWLTGHKMWDAAPMIGEGMYPGARTIWRANRFSAISLITNAFSGVIQTDLSYTPLLTMRYDRMYSSHVYSGSP